MCAGSPLLKCSPPTIAAHLLHKEVLAITQLDGKPIGSANPARCSPVARAVSGFQTARDAR